MINKYAICYQVPADYPSDVLLKNRTYQPTRMKEIYLSDSEESLKQLLKNNPDVRNLPGVKIVDRYPTE